MTVNGVLGLAALGMLAAFLYLGPMFRRAGEALAFRLGMDKHRSYVAGLYADTAAMLLCSVALMAMAAGQHNLHG